jgi:DNA primase small subunit
MMASADPVEVQKRKLEGNDDAEVDGGDMASKRAAGLAVLPMEVDNSLAIKNEDFSMDLLRIYYDRLFPFLQMFRWLSYRNDPKSSSRGVAKDFFLRREFTFVLEGDIFCRYICFRDVEEFRSQMLSRMPIRMEIGAVFTHPPKNHTTVIKDAYKPVERELVFDIDMDDYDDIRTCCTGAKLCMKCWVFMKAAIKTLRRALTEDFGFKHTLFVYSGRRGVHCWVCDKAARQLSNDQRTAVAEYLTLVTPGANKARSEAVKMNGCEELHPSIAAAHKICEYYFRDDPMGVLAGQDILRKGPHLANILDGYTSSEKDTVSKFMKDNPEASSQQIWAQLEKIVAERARSATSFSQKRDLKPMLKDTIIQYTCPRLDINVSKQMNHLLKSPFVVHPKTGRVCVPIDLNNVDNFNPLEVPTIGRLVEDINRSGDVRQTSLKPYTHYFEVHFLQPLERDTDRDMQRSEGDLSF